MTLLKDLIDIPEHVEQGQFVLRLAEGVTRPEETLHDYVVTPELKLCFEDALNFIKSGLQSKTSKASYLHGSFGSGKSHFMAVLHLILQGNTAARGIPELASVITKHNDWITGKKFLLVPYHMIGSNDMESGILGGYVEFIRRVHPDAPIPGVYLAEGLFRDAENLRKRMGDDRFFGTLREGSSVDSEFGDVDRHWDAERFDTAIVALLVRKNARSSSACSSASSSARTTPRRGPSARRSSRSTRGSRSSASTRPASATTV